MRHCLVLRPERHHDDGADDDDDVAAADDDDESTKFSRFSAEGSSKAWQLR